LETKSQLPYGQFIWVGAFVFLVPQVDLKIIAQSVKILSISKFGGSKRCWTRNRQMLDKWFASLQKAVAAPGQLQIHEFGVQNAEWAKSCSAMR
jgi:hypothetical protein